MKQPTAQKSLQKISEIVDASIVEYGESRDEAWQWVYETIIEEWCKKIQRQRIVENILKGVNEQ